MHQPADPTFCQICADLATAKAVQNSKRGEDFELACELERRAWHHLVGYLSAISFATTERNL
jgi:hypothetical protein